MDRFFSQLPKKFRYAIEIRNAALLRPEYHKVLERHSIAHEYNHWSYMPSLLQQHKRMEEHFSVPFTVIRLLTPPHLSFEVSRKRAAPYNRIVGVLPEMRHETVTLIKRAIEENRQVYVLVSNRSEGNAPLTIQRLVDGVGNL
jgi:uncharacterized protein YecE (DUF72 family)